MALDKRVEITNSPDPILERSPYAEHASAKIAHVNEALRLIRESAKTCGAKIETPVALTGTTVATLRAEVELRINAIEEKINKLIDCLS
jgi:hypothetical protein